MASVFTLGCNPPNADQQTTPVPLPDANAGKLIPINFSDSNYYEIQSYAHDTLTKDGWLIKYLVKNDSSRYKDLYIQWSKGNNKGLYHCPSVLEYRRYFIPEYIGENNQLLFFEHGCATDCGAILTLQKDTTKAVDYPHVISYSIPHGVVVFVNQAGQQDGAPFEVSAVDLMKNKEHRLKFNGLCMAAAYKEQCVDTVIIMKNKVVVKATLTVNDYNRDKELPEERMAKLK
ncbi:hypothetical protein [Flavisolibacter tropicus]|uniref:hypothetical protein n=1 Tax=Flavisolibacter tropicus TaxID=1492898 RepID=UPI0011E04E07|nr:hypothetical protein [Flavisolibacter tropicus]